MLCLFFLVSKNHFESWATLKIIHRPQFHFRSNPRKRLQIEFTNLLVSFTLLQITIVAAFNLHSQSSSDP